MNNIPYGYLDVNNIYQPNFDLTYKEIIELEEGTPLYDHPTKTLTDEEIATARLEAEQAVIDEYKTQGIEPGALKTGKKFILRMDFDKHFAQAILRKASEK